MAPSQALGQAPTGIGQQQDSFFFVLDDHSDAFRPENHRSAFGDGKKRGESIPSEISYCEEWFTNFSLTSTPIGEAAGSPHAQQRIPHALLLLAMGSTGGSCPPAAGWLTGRNAPKCTQTCHPKCCC